MERKKKKEGFKGYKVTKEEVETQIKTHSSWQLLNHIDTSGIHTQKLLSILKQETVSPILRVYRTINIFLEGKTYSKMSKKDKFPKNDLKKIREILMKSITKFETKQGKMIGGWLEKDDVDKIMEFITNRFWRPSYKSFRTLYAIGREKIKKQEKITKPTDVALNILLYLLVEHLKSKTNKPNWGLIYDFLTEQGFRTADIAEENLKDRYRKNNPDKLKKQYELYRELYLYPEQKIKRDTPLEQRQWLTSFKTYERDITLPYWFELLP